MSARLRHPFGRRLVVPRSLRIDECTTRRGGAWHVARAPAPVQDVAPRRLGTASVDLRLPSAWPEFGVLELEAGRVFGSHGWVFTDDGAVIPGLSWYGEAERAHPRTAPLSSHDRATRLLPFTRERLVLPELRSFPARRPRAPRGLPSMRGSRLTTSTTSTAPRRPRATAARLFERFDIPRAKRVWATSQTAFRAERLFVPSLPAAALAYPPWLARFLRRVAGVGHGGPSSRRLYVSRRGYGRHAVSELDVEALLAAHGFEIYDASDIRSQPEDFDHGGDGRGGSWRWAGQRRLLPPGNARRRDRSHRQRIPVLLFARRCRRPRLRLHRCPKRRRAWSAMRSGQARSTSISRSTSSPRRCPRRANRSRDETGRRSAGAPRVKPRPAPRAQSHPRRRREHELEGD